MKKRTIWGVGPKIMAPGYFILFILSWMPVKISIQGILNIPGLYLIVLSLILICMGIIMLAMANMEIKKAMETNQLVTTGLFSRIRNPMYAAHIFFIMPGVCLLTNNVITLLTILCTVIIFYVFISKEEKDLEENFGFEYINYKNSAGRLLPKVFIAKRKI